MEYIRLYNGVEVPVLGIGTFMISPEDAEKSVYAALKGGYRMIDTANAYMNEEAVGKALARAIRDGIVKREEVFVSTKIWPTVYEDEAAVEKTLKRLGLEYVDLLFIHQPSGSFMAGYKLIEKAYKEGKARSLGISNMNGEKLERLLAAAEIKPHVIQLEAPSITRAAHRSFCAGQHRWGSSPSPDRKTPIISATTSIFLTSPLQMKKWRKSRSWTVQRSITNRMRQP